MGKNNRYDVSVGDCKSHSVGDRCALYKNSGKDEFEDATIAAQLGVETHFTCWRTGFQDFDNDGHPNIFIATGSVYPAVERKLPQYPE